MITKCRQSRNKIQESASVALPRRRRGARDLVLGHLWVSVGVYGGTLGAQGREFLQTRGRPEQHVTAFGAIVAVIAAPFSLFVLRAGISVFC